MDDYTEEKNWSEKVEDLVESGHTDTAISLLENLISKFETLNSPDSQSQLASALLELANLYSSKNLSLKSDDVRSRAATINLQSQIGSSDKENSRVSSSAVDDSTKDVNLEKYTECPGDNAASNASSEDDWEAIADRASEELLSPPPCLPEVSKLSLKDSNVNVVKRRGRGTFMYKKQGLYCDQQTQEPLADDSEEIINDKPENVSGTRNSVYGTHHVLILDGFNPSTTTTDLERVFGNFKDRGFSIRWVNDTLALAVFRSPTLACEARESTQCSFSVRLLEKDDPIMSSIPIKDLDPPRQRPKTSAQTARRLIAQELGVKMPSNFGSRELRKQEDARRNRIITRQNLRDDAWGPDDTA